MSKRAHSLHHVNFATTEVERTKQWYGRVFGLRWIDPQSNTKVLLMTNGNFDIHFTPFPKDRHRTLKPLHFAIEVEDWDGFLRHLDEIGVRHTRTVYRPQNDSRFCYVHDPDGNMIELTWHARLHPQTPQPGG
jgi:lactoylglutathione lyase